eukprot:CAMPEP_0174383684 /NCGR_PEP_ID=MMETSP0811_2-20130205/125410_1 /TAXON_ID=73025 ORGANISM="Eutreptiella gymnastica-like, Strain CCMP1594" /NCGR_SAMPLE_ID=MMETSP0811_2 /ASSEMBLY_ACC=CAM_ASM_000667 /LENGTH=88 /DNA_ID=CAMNT_0015537375 /DNA_START=950 /DNA_END=1217 /DNA_ORIENTATION=-
MPTNPRSAAAGDSGVEQQQEEGQQAASRTVAAASGSNGSSNKGSIALDRLLSVLKKQHFFNPCPLRFVRNLDLKMVFPGVSCDVNSLA